MGDPTQSERRRMARRRVLKGISGTALVGSVGVGSARNSGGSRFVEAGLVFDVDLPAGQERMNYPILHSDNWVHYYVGSEVATTQRAPTDLLEIISSGRNVISSPDGYHTDEHRLGGDTVDRVPLNVGRNAEPSKMLRLAEEVQIPEVHIEVGEKSTNVYSSSGSPLTIPRGGSESSVLSDERLTVKLTNHLEASRFEGTATSKSEQATHRLDIPTEETVIHSQKRLEIRDVGYVKNGG